MSTIFFVAKWKYRKGCVKLYLKIIGVPFCLVFVRIATLRQ